MYIIAPLLFTKSVFSWKNEEKVMRKIVLFGLILLGLALQSCAAHKSIPVQAVLDHSSSAALMVEDLILLQGIVDGKEGWFVLDSGSPGIVIHKKEINVTDVGKTMGSLALLEETRFSDVQFAGIALGDVEGYFTDLSALSIHLDVNLIGLIGYQAFAGRAVLIDFPHQRVSFLDRRQLAMLKKQSAPQARISFELVDNLPVVLAQIGTEKVRLGIDSGAELNILDAGFARTTSSFTASSSQEVLGLDHVWRKLAGPAPLLTRVWEDRAISYDYFIEDLSHLSSASIELTGILGTPAIQDLLICFDYRMQYIYVWKECRLSN